MDNAYDTWNSNISRDQFLNNLTYYEKVAVIFGNLNYQVENGGFSQWYENDYYDDYEFLYTFINKSNYKNKYEFLNLLDNVNYVITAIKNLDSSNDWYDEDKQTRLKTLDMYDKEYYNLENSWKEFFQNYLIENIPEKYMNLISNIDIINKTI